MKNTCNYKEEKIWIFDLSHIPGMTLFILEVLMRVYNFVLENFNSDLFARMK